MQIKIDWVWKVKFKTLVEVMHTEIHIYTFKGDGHMIFITPTWLFFNKLSSGLMSWRQRHYKDKSNVFGFKGRQ